MYVERSFSDQNQILDEADELAQSAIKLGNRNPQILALIAQVRIMLDAEITMGAILAENALALDPCNPMAYAAMASAQLRQQDYQAARQTAMNGAAIAANTRLNHWLFSLVGLATLADGNWEKSIGFFERCHAHAPNFRSPMRHLIYLYMARSEPQRAKKMIT
ncbi:MAG: hypothetical protein ACPGRD_08370, partial [Planktomarina sp.]